MRFAAISLLVMLLAGTPLHAGTVGENTATAFAPDRYRLDETLRMSGTKLHAPLVSKEELAAQRAGHGEAGSYAATRPRRNIAAAMIASAVIPGMGQLYVATGSKKWNAP